MDFIVAVDNNWGIGKGGGMLDHLPKDLAFFKRQTEGHVIVMGRKTLESFPDCRPLPNRLNVVLTTNRDYSAPEGVVLVHSLAELAAYLKSLGREDVFLVGGASLYKRLLDVCESGFVTHIDHSYEGAEAYFPNLDELSNWHKQEMIDTIEEKGKTLRFCKYTNMNPKKLEDIENE